MEDVIFSGTSNRPAKNISEVSILIDNSRLKMVLQYNEFDDDRTVKRKIERDKGSKYYIIIKK